MTVAAKKRGSAPKHKTKLDMEATLTEVARLEAMRFSQSQIAARIGVTQPMVCQYQKKLRERYKAAQLDVRELFVAEIESNYHSIVREAEDAWKRSQQSDDDEVRRAGDATFLRVKMEAWDAIRKLRGLDAPTKVDQRTASVNVEVKAADWSALRGRPAESDPLEEVVGREQAALPEHKAERNGKH